MKDMRSSTSSKGPRLVRFAVPRAQTRVAIEMHNFSNKWCEVPRVSRGLLSKPPSLEHSERRGLFFIIAWCSLAEPEPYVGGEGLVTCYTRNCSGTLHRAAPIRLQHYSLPHSWCGCFRDNIALALNKSTCFCALLSA